MDEARGRPVLLAGVVLGLGLGGFFDGIVFHQLLQWHHMLTDHGHPMTTVPGLEVNTTWDGIFHSSTWILTVMGLGLLWRVERRYDLSWSWFLVGALLIGWGAFNVVEGVIDHHILTLHHVRDDLGGPWEWDAGFLAWGMVMLGGGWMLARRGGTQGIAAEAPSGRPQNPALRAR